jgi:hypothetical protein
MNAEIVCLPNADDAQKFYFEAMAARKKGGWRQLETKLSDDVVYLYERDGYRMEFISTETECEDKLHITFKFSIIFVKTGVTVWVMLYNGWCATAALSFLNKCLEMVYENGSGRDFHCGRGLTTASACTNFVFVTIPTGTFGRFFGTERMVCARHQNHGPDVCYAEGTSMGGWRFRTTS